jgi:NADPH:quinone reductase-like Zn-dependent oxidoreductase
VVTIADYTAPEHGVRLTSAADAPAQALAEAAALGAAGGYVPHVAATYRLEQLAEAHVHSQAGRTRGKLVISVV